MEEKKAIPDAVRRFANSTEYNGVKLAVVDHPVYGEVYELYMLTEPGRLQEPTGLPALLSFKDGVCRALSTDQAFSLLDTL